MDMEMEKRSGGGEVGDEGKWKRLRRCRRS